MLISGGKTEDTQLPASIKSITGKKFSTLKNHEKGELILSILRIKRKDIYLVHDAARGMPIEFTVQLKERMQQLKEEGALVLYLTPDELINVQSIKKGRGLYESSTWCQLVDHYKGLLDIQ
jgi:ABC-type Na+ transport system ATPase subunit NatA